MTDLLNEKVTEVEEKMVTDVKVLNEKMAEQERRTTDLLNEKLSEVEEKMVADVKAMNEKLAENERRAANTLNEKVSQMEQRMGAQEEKNSNNSDLITEVKEGVATNKADVKALEEKMAEEKEMFENFKTEMLGKFQEQNQRIVAQEEKSVEQDEKIAAQGITISAQEETIANQEGKIALQDDKNTEQEEKIARQSETILKQEEMIQHVTKYDAGLAFFVRVSNTGPRARNMLGIALIIIIPSFNTNTQVLYLRLR